jgi:hypothetical protein
VNERVPQASECNTVLREYNYQYADRSARSNIRDAIQTAENRLQEHLNYPVAPQYLSETYPWPRYNDQRVWRASPSPAADGRYISLRLRNGEVQAVGVETLSLLGTPALTYSDYDGDGLEDTFVTAAVATTQTDPAKIAVYFRGADRLDGEPVGERWRIAPVQITLAGGTVVIRGRKWLCVQPLKYEGVTNATLNPDTVSNFVTNLEVYERTTDPNGELATNAQATLIWETLPLHGWFCCCSTCANITYSPNEFDPAAEGLAVARVGIRDARLGLVTPALAVRNASTGEWSTLDFAYYREPDRATIRYLAGLPLEANGQMQERWRLIVARMAMAELGRPIATCDVANRELYHWQFDLARAAGANDEQYRIAERDLNNPFGTRRGHIYAWRQVSELALVRGTVV